MISKLRTPAEKKAKRAHTLSLLKRKRLVGKLQPWQEPGGDYSINPVVGSTGGGVLIVGNGLPVFNIITKPRPYAGSREQIQECLLRFNATKQRKLLNHLADCESDDCTKKICRVARGLELP